MHINCQSICTCGSTIPQPVTQNDITILQRDIRILNITTWAFFALSASILSIGIAVLSYLSITSSYENLPNIAIVCGVVFTLFLSTLGIGMLFNQTSKRANKIQDQAIIGPSVES